MILALNVYGTLAVYYKEPCEQDQLLEAEPVVTEKEYYESPEPEPEEPIFEAEAEPVVEEKEYYGSPEPEQPILEAEAEPIATEQEPCEEPLFEVEAEQEVKDPYLPAYEVHESEEPELLLENETTTKPECDQELQAEAEVEPYETPESEPVLEQENEKDDQKYDQEPANLMSSSGNRAFAFGEEMLLFFLVVF